MKSSIPTHHHARTPLDRFRRILRLLRSGRCVTAKRIAADLEVTPKTIYRDIDFMKYRLDLPLISTARGQKLFAPIHLCPLCQHSHPRSSALSAVKNS